MDNNMERDWLTRNEATSFIGKNTFYYLDQWKTHPDSFFKGWNWAAMFGSIEWMAYRKMYLEAFLSFLLLLFIAIGTAVFFSVLNINFGGEFLGYAFRILVGFLGNSLYRNKALRVLRRTKYMTEFERLQFLSKKGGVSVVGVVVCILLEIAYVLLLNL